MKILVISHNCFSCELNNGKTLEAIFSEFPKENLAQLFFYPERPDFNFCSNYYQITDVDIINCATGKSSKCGRIVENNEDIIIKSKLRHSSFSKKSKYLYTLRDLLWATNKWKTNDLFCWIESFQPNLIFFVGGISGFSHEIALFISKKYRIKLMSFFTDDYIISPIKGNILQRFQQFRIKKIYAKTIKQSSLLFAIGNLMSSTYSKYYKREFIPIMNSITILPYVDYPNSSRLIISYFGGLHLNRWEMIVRLSKIIPKHTTIHVYSVQKPNEIVTNEFSKYGVIYKGSVSGDDLINKINASDILLHVESDDKYNRSLTKLSISTKIPEYLISGRPILGFGPIEVASMRLLSDNNIGKVLSSELKDVELKNEILSFTTDYKLRREYGLRGYEFSISHFDRTKISRGLAMKLHNLLNN